jgi:hypothetical protein
MHHGQSMNAARNGHLYVIIANALGGRPELTPALFLSYVEGFDEAVVHRLPRPREVQHYALLVSPNIVIAGDEPGPWSTRSIAQLIELTCVGSILAQLGYTRRIGVLLRSCRPNSR